MADISEPGACQACGRPLPPQQGKGRRRQYCDARCRDTARRQRASIGRGQGVVNTILTKASRHGYLDTIESKPTADDPVGARVGDAARRLIDEFNRTGSPQDAVAAARELSAAADVALQAAVDRARGAGQSWREIGDVLGTSRQAAFQRFGHPVDPRTGAPMIRDVPPDAADRAVAIFAWNNEGRWDEIIAELDENMRRLHDPALLARGWAFMTGMYGRLERIGEPFARQAGDDTVVDVPLHFEAGDAKGIVRFSGDGKIAGMAIRPASP
jgi:hypothetical protein